MATTKTGLALDIKLAMKLVLTLQLMDGRGYSIMERDAFGFLAQLDATGGLEKNFLKSYLGDFQHFYENAEWINPVQKEKVEEWISILANYITESSQDNAQAILDFPIID